MSELTLAGRGAVVHPDVVTADQAQALLDAYGTGGKAIVIPKGVNIGTFLARAPGTFYYDDPSVSNTTGGPDSGLTYYTVVNGGIVGNRTLYASTHGSNFYIGEIYGDVFRGWKTFSQPDWVESAIQVAINEHALSRNHPYATESEPGFIQIATESEAVGKTQGTHCMTPKTSQKVLDTYGIGKISLTMPRGSDLAVFFRDKGFGAWHLDGSDLYTNAPPSGGWCEILCTSHEVNNYKCLTAVCADGTLYTATLNAGSFSGWKKKIELKDLPVASLSQQGIVQLEQSTTSTSTTTAAVPASVKAANDNANTRVPQTRRINGLELTQDITLVAGSVGAYNKAEVDNLLAQKVPQTRRVNNKPLDRDITINAGEVGAYTKEEVDQKMSVFGASESVWLGEGITRTLPAVPFNRVIMILGWHEWTPGGHGTYAVTRGTAFYVNGNKQQSKVRGPLETYAYYIPAGVSVNVRAMDYWKTQKYYSEEGNDYFGVIMKR